MKILFASSEVHPLIKTGGLADVSGSLPQALKNLRHDIRVILPAYREVLKKIDQHQTVATLTIAGSIQPVQILESRLPGTNIKLYLVDAPSLFDRAGGPYGDANGHDWVDNAHRFTLFARAAVSIGLDKAGLEWQPEIIHCNDWQTGLIPPLVSRSSQRPATLFTVHNLAYHGLADAHTFQQLDLPEEWWSMHGLEFHGDMSFIKGGLVFADWISTVSPTYAKEICTQQFGCGLEGLLQHRKNSLSGILNGVDYNTWSPSEDTLIPHSYSSGDLSGKVENKKALQERFGLPVNANIPLFAHVGRLVEQKGIDLLLDALPKLKNKALQLVLVGTGDPQLETALQRAKSKYPGKIGVFIGYDERLAHLLEAGADAFLMPSRFEPCGLNQMYSLKYGTLPIVRNTGGLADTIVDATKETIDNGTATGFVFEKATSTALLSAINRALVLYQDQNTWHKIMSTAMRQDHSWSHAAAQYVSLYQAILDHSVDALVSA